MVTNFLSLPPELYRQIASFLPEGEPWHLSAFSRCNRQLHTLLTPALYRYQISKWVRYRPLQYAAFYGHLGTLKRATDVGIPLNTDPQLLKEATWMGNTDVVEFILDSGEFDIEERYTCGRTPVINAASTNRTKTLQLLLDRGASVNDNDPDHQTNRALFEAIQSHEGRDEPEGRTSARLLIESGIDLQELDFGHHSALHEAVHCGDVELVKLLLSRGANINDPAYQDNLICAASDTDSQFELSKTLIVAGVPFEKERMEGMLVDCAGRGKLDMVTLLLEYGAGANSTDHNGKAAILDAAGGGNLEILKLLIKNGVDVNAREPYWDRTALIEVLDRSHHRDDMDTSSLIDALLEAGADTTLCDEEMKTALHFYPTAQIASKLLSHGAKADAVDNSNRTPLSIAVSGNNEVDLVKMLLEHGGNPNHVVEDNNMLHNAIDNGDESVAKLLLQYGADHTVLNEYGTNALQHAAQADMRELVDLITQKNSSVNEATESGWSPLMLAVDDGYIDIVALLLEKGADVNYATENSWPALTIAASKGHMDILTMLLDRGADINQSDPAGWCPLLIAIAYEQEEAATVLLQRGAKADVQTSSGDTSFAVAGEKGLVGIMDNLRNAITIEVNHQNKLGRSALHGAAMRGQAASVDFLLKLDPPPTATLKDTWGATPLVLAIRNGNRDVVEKLMDKSGSLLSKDALGHDAFYWASHCCNDVVLEILKSTPEGAGIDDAVEEDDDERVEFNPDTCFCDVCGRTSTCQPKYSPKKCESCRLNGEAIAICEFCIRDGAKCLSSDHEWVPYICPCGGQGEEEDDDDDDDRSSNNPSSWGYGSEDGSNSGSDQDSDNESDQASGNDSENDSDQSE